MMARRLLTPIILLFFVYLAGTVGYYALGIYGFEAGIIDRTWSMWQCAFMTAITLSTVGYGDWLGIENYHLAQAYTILILISGMGLAAYGVSQLTSFFVEGHLGKLWSRRKLMKRIDDLSGHVIVCGLGVTGLSAVRELLAVEHDFVSIDKSEEKIEWMKQHFPDALVVPGDAEDEETLQKAGIERASGLVAALTDDRDNLFLTVTARSLNPAIRIVVRADHPGVESKLLAAGANRVVTPSVTGGLRLASEMVRPQVVSFLDRMLREGGQYRFAEVVVQPGSELEGNHLSEAGVRQRTGLNIIAVLDAGGVYHYNFDVERSLSAGDTLFTIGTPQEVRALRAICGAA